MRVWAWLLPCWVWKYFYAQFPRERVLLDGRTRFLIRLDEQFALVYDPQGKAMVPQSYPSESKHSRNRVRPSFRIFEKSSPVSSPMSSEQVRANLWLRDGSGVGTQGD